jgi:hypothetical protein
MARTPHSTHHPLRGRGAVSVVLCSRLDRGINNVLDLLQYSLHLPFMDILAGNTFGALLICYPPGKRNLVRPPL